ncbi:MAG: hypothetical protein SGARI_002945 [Bacillariaceae sp.]
MAGLTSFVAALAPHAVDHTPSRRSFVAAGCQTSAAVASAALLWRQDPSTAFANTGDDGLSNLSGYSDGPRGLRYKIIQQGEGDAPLRAQQIKAKYTLWTGGFGEDGGKQVDSNTGFLGRPLSVIVGVGRVIKGWDLTLLDMKPGEIRRIVVPSDIGYGDRGAGGAIPPKATLYFEMEITEADPMVNLNDQQKKWLEDNPL